MNASLRTADRSTHAKVAMLATLSCVALVALAMGARTSSYRQNSLENAARLSSVVVSSMPHEKRLIDAHASLVVSTFVQHASAETVRR